MLVLTRKLGEGIRIGEDIRVIVVDIKENQVRIGIEAPTDMSVHREEVYLRIQEENIRASMVEKDSIDEIVDRWKKKG